MAGQEGPQLNPSSLRPQASGDGPRRPRRGPPVVVIVVAAVAIAVAAVAGVLLRGSINGDDGKEFPAIGSAEGSSEESSAEETGPLLSEKGFRAALAIARDKLGSRARVLQLRLTDKDLQLTVADSETPPQPRLLIVRSDGEVQDQRLQSITGTFFALEAVRAGAPPRIVATLRERLRVREPVDYMVLAASPINARREWIAFANTDNHDGYRAEADGSDVRRLGQPSRAERAANERRRRQFRRRVRCVRRAAAAGDSAGVQRCINRFR